MSPTRSACYTKPSHWPGSSGVLCAALLLSAARAHAQAPPSPTTPAESPPPTAAPAPADAETAPSGGEPPASDSAGPSVVPPRLLKFVDAPYPAEAERLGLSGDVVLVLQVEASGKVSEVVVQQPAGHGFDEAAIQAARAFEFAPALVDGTPTPVKIPFKYSFTLQQTDTETELPEASPGTLAGKLLIAGADAPLAGASVTATSATGVTRQTLSDVEGSWSLGELPEDRYRISVRADGFLPIDLEESVLGGQSAEIVYRLSPKVGGAIVVSVVGERPPREIVRRTLTRREMTKVPGTSGDALRGLQNLPGLARPPGLAGLLIVRGSAPQDTAVFVDGDEVPFIYHFGGLSSAIPTELLENINFYPGNFGSRYGRVMGGIVDVGLRTPDMQCTGDYGKPSDETGCFHGLAQVDLIDARALVQGPLPFDGWSFAAGGRRSWVDAWLGPVLEDAGASVTSAPVYNDYQLIAASDPSRNSSLSLRIFGSNDSLELLIDDPSPQDPGAAGGGVSFATSFIRAQSVLESRLSRRVRLKSMLSVGKDTVEFSLGRFRFQIESYPIQTRNEFEWTFARGMNLRAGFDFQVLPFDLLVRLPEPPRPGEAAPGPFSTRPLLETERSDTVFRPAWYVDAELRLTDDLTLTPGLRLDYASDTGQGDLSPRITARYDLTKNQERPDGSLARRTTLKAGLGLFHQPAQFQETDPVFGTPGLESNRATHASLGVERELSDHVELQVETFYKNLGNIVSRDPTLSGSFEYGNEGSGDVIGAETLLKYKADDRFFGWLAYTLSRSRRRDGPDEALRPFQFDQTHILTVLGSYKLGRGWEVGARFRIVSGPLDTPTLTGSGLPALFAADAAAYAPLQGEPFSERLPLVHQLDLRMEKAWQYRTFRLTFFVDVWNAYNNPAREALNYNFDFSQRNFQQGLPLIPSFGLRGQF